MYVKMVIIEKKTTMEYMYKILLTTLKNNQPKDTRN